MLKAIDLTIDDVYIANIVKCRPPNNRDPQEEEQEACLNYFALSISACKTKIIVCLGRIAGTAIISPTFRITKQRGQWIERKGY